MKVLESVGKRFRSRGYGPTEKQRERRQLRVAFEFRTVEFRQEVACGVVEETAAFAGDTAAVVLTGLDVAGVFELLERRSDDVARALGLPVGPDAVAGRPLLRGAVLGAEGVDADGTVDSDLPEEAGGAARPEVLLLGWEFAVDAGLGVLGPVRRFDVVFVCERLRKCLDEFLGGTS